MDRGGRRRRGAFQAGKSVILHPHAAGALARASDGGGRGKKGRRAGSGRQKRGGTAAQPDGIVKQVRIGGRPMQLHAMGIVADPSNPYASIPGGGDQEAAETVARAGAAGMKGDYEEAERLCKSVLARFPNHYMANYNLSDDVKFVELKIAT